MRFLLGALVTLLTIFLVVFVAGFLWAYYKYTSPGPLDKSIVFVVEKGQGVSSIADRLLYIGVLDEPLVFRAVARLSGKENILKAGEYEFTASISQRAVLNMLAEGAVYRRSFTVIEGLTSWQVVKLLEKTEGLEGDVTEIPEEGSLLPETYQFQYGDLRAKKIKWMQIAMQSKLAKLWDARADNLPFSTLEEAVILASIIEKETGVSGERDKVAGVFVNRLRIGMALQSDPTVIYALTGGKIQTEGKGPLGRRLLKKDLEIDSPYNTYKYPGLPPGPIANPGYSSIKAALNPAAHDYIYFVADGTGGHAFAKTLEQHNKNVARWRKIRRAQENN